MNNIKYDEHKGLKHLILYKTPNTITCFKEIDSNSKLIKLF